VGDITMKKMIIAMILFSCINVMAFSLFESWFSTGFEYGNLFEKNTVDDQTIESYIGSPGFDIDSFQFWDNFGFVINISFLFPQNISMLNGEYKYNFQFAYIIGPAFKLDLNERMKIKLGAGFSSVQTFGKNSGSSLLNSNFGIGGDIGFVYIVNPLININIGTIANYQFANIATLNLGKSETSEWAKNYSMICLRPYIRIGFMFKPK
jgi:hypothetical protein